MNNPTRYLITSALPYANGLKHIGHLAGAYLPADIYTRYLRAQNREVVFVCGSDEHGTAIPIQAKKEGTTAREIIDKYHPIIEQNFKDLGISFDIYHRTSSPIHHTTAQEFFTELNNNGHLEIKETEQYYDDEAKMFLADRFIKGTCPNCSYNNAFGDQCEKCGKSLSPEELINPVSTLSGKAPIKKLTSHWYLPLNKHEEFLKEWVLNTHKEDWRANVVGNVKSWIDAGLQPRAVTRDLDWGVKVPVKTEENKVLYVWFDAPIGYISATKQWALDNDKDWKPYWYNNDTKLVHFIGKDNIVFHAIIFPVMLKLHGNILPDNVPSNEFMNLEGDKMSTSRGWSIEMEDYINGWIKKENGGESMADVLRYYLTNIAPETKDSEFTWKGFQDANNSELVSIFGNYVNRTFVLMHKLCGGKVPAFHNNLLDETDKQLIIDIAQTKNSVEQLLEQYKFREAQFEVIDLARKANQYMQKKEPWIVAKTLNETPNNQQLIDNCMHLCLQLTANLAILINPFLPFTAKKMLYMMKVVDKMLEWKNAGSVKLLSVGYSLREPQLLFRKIEAEEINEQLEKLKQKAMLGKTEVATSEEVNVEAELKNFKPEIQFDDFTKIDLRIGTIKTAEKVAKADKLLKLEVDLGSEVRTIVSGIAMHFTPEEIINKQVTVVCNLAPRKMRGIESNGMILMAEDNNGKLHFINPDNVIKEGSSVS
ncbi:MAG TPA: methionine--tRNA ligase [Chitinophagaceae bacterium]|nr:methionine--tRNA ligase [Chitinophagaceae bacterium]HMZ45558.1 methionine--tRNA ligase [Chitinophagaceae bacterium]HNE93021.1 methionine--tRNA ligase [Chitinophagaceae bacterium]HNL82224.1 methionine--tRNA ligase [Chitinophagaceae bacterium]HNM35055.1 methionine--tRNA ligase [Chitinophagaceae bacterium]